MTKTREQVVMISRIDGVVVAVMLETRNIYKDNNGNEFLSDKTPVRRRRGRGWPKFNNDRPWYELNAWHPAITVHTSNDQQVP